MFVNHNKNDICSLRSQISTHSSEHLQFFLQVEMQYDIFLLRIDVMDVLKSSKAF